MEAARPRRTAAVFPYQKLRERVLADFPGQRTVQLPQSINFVAGEVLKRRQRRIRAHSQLTILLRGAASRRIAIEHFDCTVMQRPDMAFMLDTPDCTHPAQDFRLVMYEQRLATGYARVASAMVGATLRNQPRLSLLQR
jgi:exopolysaccharide biosynthesis predicted pyruvyltransferase EpsI